MANTKAVYARIDNELKEKAEKILEQLGLSPSAAISMFYSQIAMRNGMPFEVKVIDNKPLDIGKLTKEEIAAEVLKGYESIGQGKGYTLDEVKAELKEEFGV